MIAHRLSTIKNCNRIFFEGSTRRLAFNIGGAHLLDDVDEDAWRRGSKDIGLGERYALERIGDMSGRVRKVLDLSAAELIDQGFPQAKEIAKAIKAKGGMSLKK